MTEKQQLRGHFLSCITILIWGTTFITTKVLLESFTPAEILFIRFTLGYLALWLIHPHILKMKCRMHEVMAAVTGLCGVTIYYAFENIALTYSTASNVGVVVSSAPLFTAIFAAIYLREKLKPRFFIGFVRAIVGIALISFTGQSVQVNPIGDLLALCAAVAWGVYSVVMRRLTEQGYPTKALTRRCFFYGLLFMTPYVFASGFSPSLEALSDPMTLLQLGHLAFLAGTAGFISWNTAVAYLGAVKSSVYIYVTPVITILTAALVLGERMTPAGALGVALVLIGVVVSDDQFAGIFRRKKVGKSS